MSGDRTALVLVAHADDETLGCGGIMQRLAASGWRVEVVIVSDGIVRARGIDQDNRPAARRACTLLGVGEPRFLGIADQRFDAVPMADLANAVGALGIEPDLVVTHVGTDLNGDHRLTLEIAKIIGRPKRKPVGLLGCEVPATTAWNTTAFAANYFVPLTDEHLKTKIAAFACYEHEIQPFPHPWSERGLRLLAEYHGMQAGCGLAEAFHLMRGYPRGLPD